MVDKNGKPLKINDEVLIFNVRGKVLDVRLVDAKNGKQEAVAFCETPQGICAGYQEELQKVGEG